jgi:ABC-2 type transport system permease protein
MSNASAVIALLLRDLRQVIRARSQLYSSMLTPLFLLVLLGTGVSEGLEPTGLSAGDYTAYLVAGVLVMAAVFSSTFSSASFYRDRDTGLLRYLLTAPVHPRVILLGKSMAAVVIGVVQSLIVFAIAAPFVEFEWDYGVLTGVAIVVAATVLLNLFLAGVAQALASRISTMQGFHLVMNLVLFPLLFFSGAFFPVENLPAWLAILARINPLSYAVDAILLAAYADSSAGYFGLGIDFAVLIVLAVAVYVLGMARLPRLTFSGR